MNKIHNTDTLSQSQNGRNKIPFSFNSNDSFVTAMTRNAFSKSLWLYKQSSTGPLKKGRAEDFRVGVALAFCVPEFFSSSTPYFYMAPDLFFDFLVWH